MNVTKIFFYLIFIVLSSDFTLADQSTDLCGQKGETWRPEGKLENQLELLYSYDFSDPAQIEDWVAEGPANVHS